MTHKGSRVVKHQYNQTFNTEETHNIMNKKMSREIAYLLTPSKHLSSQERRYNVAATSRRCNDVIATLCVCWACAPNKDSNQPESLRCLN